MRYFFSKFSKTSHLNHKYSDQIPKFSYKWSPGEGARPPLVSVLGSKFSKKVGVNSIMAFFELNVLKGTEGCCNPAMALFVS